MLVIICKRQCVVIFFVFFVGGFFFLVIGIKIVGIKGKNHIYRLFCRCFLFGSFFCYRLFCRCFLYGSFLCYRLFSRYFLFGSFFCYRLFSRCFLYESFFCYRLFSRCFLYGSFFCYRLFCRCFLYGSSLLSLFLSLLFSKTLLYFIKQSRCFLGSFASFFLFLSDLFLDGLASSSFLIFLFLGKSSLFLGLFTLLSRSHRTLFCILFELLSVLVGVIEGRKSFFVQARCLLLASFARITVSVITLTWFGISTCACGVIFPYA